MEIKTCIFDLDGVICDTAKYHYLAWKALADKLGFDFTPEHNEGLKGVSRMKSLEILLSIGGIRLTESEKQKKAEEKNAEYLKFIYKMTPDEILPGVYSFIESLKQNNVSIALGSASKNARIILTQLKMLDVFDAIIDGNMVSEAKPNPEVFLKGAQMLNVDPPNCVVFEDAIAGVEAAKNAGMAVIGIGDEKTLKCADVVWNSFYNKGYDDVIALMRMPQ